MHPLDGAYEQVRGAREHLDSLRPDIQDFAKVVTNGVSLNYEERIVKINGVMRRVPMGTASATVNLPAPLRVSRLIGEVVRNLRSALDFLIYELACFDAKAIVERTQFVIVDSEKEFREQKWHLRGLSGEHIAAFERLQPYHPGCQWTGILRDLSNPANHKHLTTVRSPVTIAISGDNTEAILAGKHVDVNSYASVQIAFSNGVPVIEGLEQLVLDVAHSLDAFKSEFQGPLIR